jgi:MoaA/NifB/PqqE/SkfB family radical SAM enzyme
MFTNILPKPIPAGGVGRYRDELNACLSLSPKKKENYDKYLSRKEYSLQELDYLPIKLDIENVSRCNFRCQMCQVSDWDGGKRAEDMTFPDFKKLIDQQYGVVELKIQGMGEPIMGKDNYFQMIRYAREQRIWVRSVTNASLLHLSENYKKIIDSDVNELQISIDGSTKEVFEKIRDQSNFEKVVENCSLVNSYADSQGRQVTKMWTVVQGDNRHQLRDLVTLAAKLKFPSMVFSLDLSDWGQDDWAFKNAPLKTNNISDEEGFKLIEQGKELGVDVYFWYLDSKYSTDSRKTLCPWPFERAYVSSEMRIVPCCMIATPDVEDLGDALDFSEEWNGAKYQQFRQRHIDGDLPAICTSCYQSEKNK